MPALEAALAQRAGQVAQLTRDLRAETARADRLDALLRARRPQLWAQKEAFQATVAKWDRASTRLQHMVAHLQARNALLSRERDSLHEVSVALAERAADVSA